MAPPNLHASRARPLHAHERRLIEGVAEVLPGALGAQLRADSDRAMAVDEGGLHVEFVLADHARPTPLGEHPYPVDIEVADADGEALTVILSADERDRLLQMEIIRWDDDPVIAPKWDEVMFAT